MSVIYQQGGNYDLAPLKSVGIDDDSATAFWGGTQKCFAHIALAAFLVTTSLSTSLAQQVQQRSGEQSDVPAGNLVKSTALDYNDYWNSEVAPVVASLYQNLPLGDKEEIPAGQLFGEPDEDFWQNEVAPVPATLVWPQQFVFGEQSDVPAGSLKKFTSPDEDYWQNPIFALPAAGGVQAANLYQPLPYFFDSGDGAAPLVQDEDFWQNAVPPVPSTNLCPQPWLFDVQEPAGSLYGQPDEDFWLQQQLPPPIGASLYQALPYPPSISDPEELPAGNLHGQPDEDFWVNAVAAVPASLRWPQPYLFDIQEPAGSLYGQADEDYWQNPVAAVPASCYRSPVQGDQEEIPGSLVASNPDEDYWQNQSAPLAASVYQNLPYFFDSVDFTPTFEPIQDEDLWQNPASPVQSSLYRSPVFADPEEVPAGSLKKFTSPDEDYWQLNVLPAPVAANLYQRLPYAIASRDVEEIPAGRLFGQYDEDFWKNAVAPVAAALYQRLPIGDPEELPAGSLYGQLDEDFWINPVAPVAASLYRSPVFRDPEEVPGQLKNLRVEEDYWQNRVAPVAATLYQTRPYLFDAAETVPAPFIPDEDFWQNSVQPVAAANQWSQPWLFEQELPEQTVFVIVGGIGSGTGRLSPAVVSPRSTKTEQPKAPKKLAKAPKPPKPVKPAVPRNAVVKLSGFRGHGASGEIEASASANAIVVAVPGLALHSGTIEVRVSPLVTGFDRELESFARWFVINRL